MNIPLFIKEAKPNWDEVEKFVDQPNTFIHFSDILKLGLNPKSEFNTPIGIYGYPLTNKIYQQYKVDKLPFAADRKYTHVFTINPAPKSIQDITKEDLEKAVAYAAQQNVPQKIIDRAFVSVKPMKVYDKETGWQLQENQLAAQFWNLTRLSSKNPVLWNKTLRDLGYSGFVDFGSGLIHPSEPTQGFALSIAQTSLIASIENPTSGERKQREKTKYDHLIKELPEEYSNARNQIREQLYAKQVAKLKSRIQHVPTEYLSQLLYGFGPAAASLAIQEFIHRNEIYTLFKKIKTLPVDTICILLQNAGVLNIPDVIGQLLSTFPFHLQEISQAVPHDILIKVLSDFTPEELKLFTKNNLFYAVRIDKADPLYQFLHPTAKTLLEEEAIAHKEKQESPPLSIKPGDTL